MNADQHDAPDRDPRDEYDPVYDQEDLRKKIAVLSNGLLSVLELISDSRGVSGLHLNGNNAEWSELRTGGRYEGWLVDFDTACQVALL
jgi:hypothetical protein